MMSRKVLLLVRGMVSPVMNTQLTVIKTFSCSSSMFIRRPLDQIDDFEKDYGLKDLLRSGIMNLFKSFMWTWLLFSGKCAFRIAVA